MYSKAAEAVLKKANASPGDRVRITSGGKAREGILMPKGEAGDPDILVIKLSSGYNLGLPATGAKAEKLSGKKTLGRTVGVNLAFDKKKPPISMVVSGGTIASRVDYRTGGVYAVEEPEEFLFNVPEIREAVNVKSISKPISKMSEDMGWEDWVEIAKAVHKELKSDSMGVVVTHGTDTLHYTAAALSFFLGKPGKPVVLVGSQRSSDRGSSDAGMNLVCAAHAALSDIAEVGTCMHGSMNDDYCLFIRGTKARKMDSQRRDAFRPVNEYPLAKVWPDGKLQVKNNSFRIRSDAGKPDFRFNPNVAILKVYPGSDPGVVDYYAGKGCKGFVLEATGFGHVPANGRGEWISAIRKHPGIHFVTTLQTIYGRINTSVYSNLRKLYREENVIPGQDMLTEAAYVKLGWVLGHAQEMDQVRREMLTNVAGEITSRTLAGSFLY